MSVLPNDEIMRELTKLAIEQGTTILARQAREFANNLPSGVSGRDALNAFADSIDSTNATIYPKMGGA